MLDVNSGAVYYGSAVVDGSLEQSSNFDSIESQGLINLEEFRQKFNFFIKNFNQAGEYIYREQLIYNISIENYYLKLCLHHLTMDDIANSDIYGNTAEGTSEADGDSQTSRKFNRTKYSSSFGLLQCLKRAPLKYIPICERLLKELYVEMVGLLSNRNDLEKYLLGIPDIQLQLDTSQEPILVRDLKSELMEKLVVVPGIVIQASRPQKKATKLRIICRHCKSLKTINIPVWRQGVLLPRVCSGTLQTSNSEMTKCPIDPFIVLGDESEYIDIQNIKFQELPEHVSTGDIPRHMSVHLTRSLIDRVIPGNRVYVVGILSSVERETTSKGLSDSNVVRNSYIHALGLVDFKLDKYNNKLGDLSLAITSSKLSNLYNEIEEFRRISLLPNIHQLITESIAPAIYGSTIVKQAISCLLFSGSPKLLPDNTRIRGDINILLLGDPSTAKSQVLKFVEQVAPICIYTSGKGSSAAGLTAAIVRDSHNGVYALEGGAMVLADGGIVCIDEFDKMRDDDRVAIHEAMEQQTLSIAKAGITTVLKAQCSILAAANPTFGSYDDSKDITQQHDFETTILSRFDLIFLIKDEKDIKKDKLIASHIVDLHSGVVTSSEQLDNENSDISQKLSIQQLQKYIKYCRENINPRLSIEASNILENYYVKIREDNRVNTKARNSKDEIPITVRQLEAITRISESFAKMEMKNVAEEKHVDMAIKLFTNATIEAIKSNILWIDNMTDNDKTAILDCENAIKNRLAIKSRCSKNTLIKDLALIGYDPHYITKAIKILIQKGDLIEKADYSILRVK